MEFDLEKLRKIWVNGTTGQKDGKISRETLTAVDAWIFGCGKELRKMIQDNNDKICDACLKEILGVSENGS